MEPNHNYTSSIKYDRRLYKHDIAGSIAHARMLTKQGIVEEREGKLIIEALASIQLEIEAGSFPWRTELEDIHMNIERRLFEKIGDTAGKLHTARSRNDQIALDMRMYAKDAAEAAIEGVHSVRSALLHKGETNAEVLMPGYTHLQRAQPVLFAHHMLAYFEMFGRDKDRLKHAALSADVMPLGSGALAGTPHHIDRDFVANELGFDSISANSMDAVSDRDFILDYLSAAATCMVHISRLAEELILWSSEEFSFVRLDEDFTTGSSMMPQKRNPDFAELARGKTGRVVGNLVALLTMLKGLPLTYNRDLQEDKETFFDTVDVLQTTLEVIAPMISSLELNSGRMLEAAEKGYSLATDVADYLVAKGMPFREAHGVTYELTNHAAGQGKKLNEVPLKTYQEFSNLFDSDILSITTESSIRARNVPGGTSHKQVSESLVAARQSLENDIAG